jgi:hypothetical protein
MYIAHKLKRISDEELADALLEQVTFGVPYSPRLEREDWSTLRDEALYGPIQPPADPEAYPAQ